MKKALILATCLLSFACINAQTYTSGHIHVTVIDSMYNDSTNCTAWCNVYYNITIDSSYTGDTVNIVDTGCACLIDGSPFVNTTGVSSWSFTTATYGYGDYDYDLLGGHAHFAFPTIKITSGTDTLRYITTYDSFLVTNPCLYDTAQGYVYIDNNSDCIFDSGDVGLYPVYPYLTENLSSPVVSLTNVYPNLVGTNGWYLYLVQKSWMVNFTVSLPAYYAFIFPYSACFTGYPAFTALPDTGVDFPLQCTSNVDVQCNALSPENVRLHRSFFMQPYVTNTGCDSVSGEMHFIIDSRLVYDASLSLHPADTVHGDTLIWNYSGLSNLSGGAYWNSFFADVYLTPDSTVVVGDTLCFSGYANIPPADVNPANNSFAFCLPVVYSYDPNSKEVSPAGTGPEGYIPAGPDTLTYALHFQNTGSDVADNIVIIDTLDSHINAGSMRILGTSHNMTPQWLTPHVVQFNYNNILLPDSGTNYAASQGEVRFSVALNASIPFGTQIKNTGYIYFDTNPAVVTNTTLNTIALPTSITQVTTGTSIKVYPNPATDQIVVENLNGGELSILNVNGSVMIRQNVVNNKTTIDVSSLPGGVYILKTVNNANTATIKFTKY